MQELCPDQFEKQYCKASALIVEDAVICRRIESFQSYLDVVKQVIIVPADPFIFHVEFEILVLLALYLFCRLELLQNVDKNLKEERSQRTPLMETLKRRQFLILILVMIVQ